MSSTSRPPRQKSWQENFAARSVEAQVAVTRTRLMARLRELRELAGTDGKPMSQEDAARKAGITTRQYQRWESGQSMPYARNLGGVAEGFGVTMDFFEEEPEEEAPEEKAPPALEVLDGDRRNDDPILNELAVIHDKLDWLTQQVDGLRDLIPMVAALQSPPAGTGLTDEAKSPASETTSRDRQPRPAPRRPS